MLEGDAPHRGSKNRDGGKGVPGDGGDSVEWGGQEERLDAKVTLKQ